MPTYIVKNVSNSFDTDQQPDGFKAIMAIENRFFICECPTPPNGEMTIFFPEQYLKDFVYFRYSNGIKLPFDAFNGEVEITSPAPDHRGRDTYRYNESQILKKLSVTKWIMINVWLIDRAKIENLSQETVNGMINEINLIDNLVDLRKYISDNLYYNL